MFAGLSMWLMKCPSEVAASFLHSDPSKQSGRHHLYMTRSQRSHKVISTVPCQVPGSVLLCVGGDVLRSKTSRASSELSSYHGMCQKEDLCPAGSYPTGTLQSPHCSASLSVVFLCCRCAQERMGGSWVSKNNRSSVNFFK